MIQNSATDMIFNFKEQSFEGLHFNKFKQYPWNSKKEAEAYFDELVEDGSHLSRVKYQDLMKEQFDEKIHIFLSWNLIFTFAAWSLLALAVFVSFKALLIPSLVILGLGAASKGLSTIMENQAYAEEAAKAPAIESVKFIFNN